MIIGLTGPICAGKDEVGKILSSLGFKRFSLVEALREEARARGIELTRKNLQDLGDELRKIQGADVLARKVMKQVVSQEDCVIESIRNPAEVLALKELPNFVLLCVNASDDVRFERMLARGREKDPKTFDEFLLVEARDKGIGQPEHAQQNQACWALADFSLQNNGSLDELRGSIKNILSGKGFVPFSPVNVVTSFPSEESALEMARALVEKRVVACAQVLPARSLFWWNGKVQEVPEWVCFMKGKDFNAMEGAIREKHPYEVPEIMQLSVERGNSDYISWLMREAV